MVSGFITSVQGKVIAGKYVVLAKVPQHINDHLIPIWIVFDILSSSIQNFIHTGRLKPRAFDLGAC